jgi:hypothetical protein
MSNELLTLWCWFLGKPPHEKFAYTLSSTSNVGELKTMLKDLNWHGHLCDDMAAESLRLWKVSELMSAT